MYSRRGILLVALIFISVFDLGNLGAYLYSRSTEEISIPYSIMLHAGSQNISIKNIYNKLTKMRIRGENSDKIISRNISDLVFHYYDEIDTLYINFKPKNHDILNFFKVADALYKEYLRINDTKYADSLLMISWLAYTTANNTYVYAAEKYWDWLYINKVDSYSHFLPGSSRANSAKIGTELFSLYLLYSTTGKTKYRNNITEVCESYEQLVLDKIKIPASGALKTTTLINSSSERIIDVRNGTAIYSTWESREWAGLVLIAEMGYLNKTKLAEAFKQLFYILAWNKPNARLHEAHRIYIYNNSGAYRYEVKSYDYFSSARLHTQTWGFFVWANESVKILGLENATNSTLFQYYNSGTKTIRYKTPSDQYEQYSGHYGLNAYIYTKKYSWQILNNSILGYVVSPLPYPFHWWYEVKLGVKHSRIIDFSASRGSIGTSYGTSEFRPYTHLHDTMASIVLFWLKEKYVYLNPFIYYAFHILYQNCTADDGFYDYYSGYWRHGSLTELSGFIYIPVAYAHPRLDWMYLMPALGNGFPDYQTRIIRNIDDNTISIDIYNIELIKGRTAYIFFPTTKYNLTYAKINDSSANVGELGLSGNVRFVCLSDNVLALYPNTTQKSVIVNISVRLEQKNVNSSYILSEGGAEIWGLLYGISDYSEDPDNDGIINLDEAFLFSNPYSNDSDNDGISDKYEILYRVDPLSQDSDCDGLLDEFELYGVARWSAYLNESFNPRNPKSYNSTYNDIFYGFIMENQSSNLMKWNEIKWNEEEYIVLLNNSDFDGDGLSNSAEVDGWIVNMYGKNGEVVDSYIVRSSIYINDSDGDGLRDLDEKLHGSDPFNWDTDGDGLADYFEVIHGYDPVIFSYPVVEVFKPYNNSAVAENLTLSFYVNATDGAFKNWSVTIYWENGSIIKSYYGDDSGNHTIFTDILEFGRELKIEFNVYSMNNLSKNVSIIVFFYYIEFTSPQNLSYLSTNLVNISWIIRNDSNIKNAGLVYWNETCNFSHEIDPFSNKTALALSEGLWHILIWYTNEDNITFRSFVLIITIDLTKPILLVEITNSSEPCTLFGANDIINISWVIYEDYLDQIFIYVDGVLRYIKYNNGSVAFFSEDLGNGSHNISIKAVDKAENSISNSTVIFVDIEPPRIDLKTYRNGTESMLFGYYDDINISWFIYDSLNVSAYLYINGSLIEISANGSIIISANDLEEARYNITIMAVDSVGNRNSASIIIIMDFSVDKVYIDIPQSKEILGLHYTNQTLIIINASDKHYITMVEIYIDNILWKTYGLSEKEINLKANISCIEGMHTIKIIAYDSLNNNKTVTVRIVYDATPPILIYAFPDNSTFINCTNPTIEWLFEDMVAIDHYELSIDNEPWINVKKNTTWDVSGLYDGEHTIRIKAIDIAGNMAIIKICITVDTTPPKIITFGPNKTVYSKSIRIYWTVEDNIALDHFEISIDNGTWINIGLESEYSLYLENGRHIVKLRAFDKANNCAEETIIITVKEVNKNTILILTMVTLLIIIVVSVYLIQLRKEKNE